MDKTKLSKELQEKSISELKKLVQEQSNKRKEIEQKIKELDKKRRKFVFEKQKKDELNSVIIQAIKR